MTKSLVAEYFLVSQEVDEANSDSFVNIYDPNSVAN